MFLVIQEIIAHTKFIKSDNSVYKSSSLAVLALLFTQFMMELTFLLHTNMEEHFLSEDIDIWLLERERMVKNFGDVLIDCAQL